MRALQRGFLALAILICGLSQSQASIIFNTMPDNPASTPETLLGRSIMNVITVGGSDVDITGETTLWSSVRGHRSAGHCGYDKFPSTRAVSFA